MTRDLELEALQADWLLDTQPMPDIRRTVRRQRTRMMVTLAAEVLLSVAWLSGSAVLALHRPSASVFVLVAGIWAFVAAAMTFSVWNTLGAWRPGGESVLDFVELVRKRYRRDLRTARFGMVLLLVQVVFILAWTHWNRNVDVFPSPGALVQPLLALPVVIPIVAYLWLRWWRNRALRELAALEETRLGLISGPAAP